MIEYWAVIGLACLDDEFRKALEGKKEKDAEFEGYLKDQGFRLSRYEVGEVKRLIGIPEVIQGMDLIYRFEWNQFISCLTAKLPDEKYKHPTFILVDDQVVTQFAPSVAEKLAGSR
ncbi:MAG TPA: hypothetical protein VNQ79_12480 [Blastocatellia bacterium]|nr:hypothetical protein [Blastocatellia bacterium]